MVEILSYTDFTVMDKNQKKAVLEEYTKKYTVKEVAKEWGRSYSNTYSIFQRYNVKVIKKAIKGQKNKKNRKGERKLPISGGSNNQKLQLPAIIETKTNPKDSTQICKINGLSLSYNGKYSSLEITNRLEKLGLILSDEPGKFNIELTITEIES